MSLEQAYNTKHVTKHEQTYNTKHVIGTNITNNNTKHVIGTNIQH